MKFYCFEIKVHGVEGEQQVLISEKEAVNVLDAEDLLHESFDAEGYKVSVNNVNIAYS